MNELADTTEIVEPAAGQVITRIPAAGIEADVVDSGISGCGAAWQRA